MRKILILITLAAFLICVPAHAGTWVDEWFDNATLTTGGVGMINGSSRNYYSAGYGSVRWQTGVDYPISVGLPSVRFGCGGVDIFLGSMDLMNFDYLVSRLKNMMYSAGAFAFQYALSRLNPKANQILQSLDATANFLNSLQLDECRAGKAVAMKLMAPFSPEAAKDLGTQKAGIAQALGIEGSWEEVRKSWEKALPGGATSSPISTQDLNRMITGCPTELNNIIAAHYFLQYLSNKGLIVSNFLPLVRGLVGDIEVDPNSGEFFRIEPCKQKSWDIVTAVSNGTAQKCTGISSLKCTCADFTEGKNLKTKVHSYLTRYLTRLSSKGKLTNSTTDLDTRAFMSALTYYPVYDIMKMAYQAGINAANITSDSIVVKCATDFYAAGLLANILTEAERLQKMTAEWKAACSKSTDVGRCIYCKSDKFEAEEKTVTAFVNDVRNILYNYLNIKTVAKRSEACMSLEKAVTSLNRMAEIEQRYSLPTRLK